MLRGIKRRKPIRLGNILDRVRIEKGVERLGRPGDGDNGVARGPAVNFSDTFDDQCLAKVLKHR